MNVCFSGDGPLRSYESLKSVCAEIGLRCPERITSVNLRKFAGKKTSEISMEGKT